MRQSWMLVVVVVAAVFLVNVRCQENATTPPPPKHNATYWVTTSNKFWLGRPMQLVVQILVGDRPVSVSMSITYQSYEFNSTKQTLFTSAASDVYPGAPQTLKIDIPSNLNVSKELWSGTYKIVVVGQGETINFRHEDFVTLQTNAISVYVVTDKGIYKPGQKVRFRVLAMEPESLKVSQEPKNIYITDPKGNRIKQYLGVTGRSGVVDETLDLAPSTPTGDWTISVTTRDQKVEKTFTVDQYVLPKFEVTVKPPAIPLSSDTMFPITVKATYTFGQPVAYGSVSVRITVNRPWLSVAEIERGVWRTKGKLNSSGEFLFRVTSKELLNVALLTDSYSTSLDYAQFTVEANVTEDSTQRVLTGSAPMNMFRAPYSIQVVPITPSSYKPGMPYAAYVEVKKADGSSLSSQENGKLEVTFNATYEVLIPAEELETTPEPSRSDNSSSSFEKIGMIWFPYKRTRTKVLELGENVRTLSETGFANITYVLPAEAVSMNLIASLNDPFSSVVAYKYASAFHSPSNNYIQLSAPLATPKVGDTITFKATATELMTDLNYQVLSKGVMVTNGTVLSPTNEGSKTLSFDLKITHAMTPSLTIIVFYLRKQDSEMIPDSLTLSVDGLFQTPVSIEFDKEKVKPGESLNVVVRAEPNSTVFYQAVDKSVLLLKSGNQLTQDMVRDDLAAISFGNYYPWARYMFICGWPSMNSGTTADSVLHDAGILAFTDGNIPKSRYSESGFETDDKLAMSSAGAMGDAAPAPSTRFLSAERVRKNFPETWLWEVVVIDFTGTATIPTTAPDTITSFHASTFGVHPKYGLSVGKDTAVVTVFRELFVSVELPPFLIRYEDFCFPASVFSYYPEPIQVFLKFDSSDQFNGTRVIRQGDSVGVVKEKMSFIDFYPDVAENDVRSSRFCFSPIMTGDITLKISALTTVAGLSDAVEQVVSVKPEGVPRSNSYPFLVNVTSGFWQTTAKIIFPVETVPDSQMVTVSFAGNIMGSFSDNLGDLVRQPYGCGEQNMLNFAPNIYVLQYYISTGTLTPEVQQSAVANIITGYQTELKYEHATGGFSAFGDQDKNASQWLSAFVLRCFAQASNLNNKNNNSLGIDMAGVMYRTASFIMSNQNENGSFNENGVVFHKEMQSGSAQGEALTAYTLIALMEYYKTLDESSDLAPRVLYSAMQATNYIAGQVSVMTDPYDIVLACYALHLYNHPAKDVFFDKMEALAITGDGLKYWRRANSLQLTNAVYAWSVSADCLSVEMAAYALLCYDIRDIKTTEGLPIVRYLTNQRGPNGGFVSTQDTVVGLQAMATVMGSLSSPEDYSATLTISYTDGMGKSQAEITKISKATESLLQKVYINYQNDAPSSIILTVTTDDGGRGPELALLDVTLDYNVKDEPLAICYNMSHSVNKTRESLTLTISIAAANENATGMSTLEVEIPAGYSVDEAQVKEENDNANLVEFDHKDKLVLYYNGDVITTEGISATITMFRTNGATTEPKSRSYTITNYYQPNCRQTKNYFSGRDHICIADPNNGICRYVHDDYPEVTS